MLRDHEFLVGRHHVDRDRAAGAGYPRGVARILGRIGDPSSRAPLDELTKDPNTDVMREAVNALRQMNTR